MSQIKISLDKPGVFHVPSLSSESVAKANHLLQENHDNNHIFFNESGFHNHVAHHLLTLYALGASAAEIQSHYDNNNSYQRPHQPVDDKVIEDLRHYEKFHEYLGDERYYHDYLVFFQNEIESKGFESVINEYCLKGDERANDMLVRMHAGFLHPIIHLGIGVEFQQPAIIAEALAQAAVHDDWIGSYLLEAEKAAASSGQSKSMVDLLHEIRADKVLSTAAHWEDSNKVRDGILVRAPDQMINIGSQWRVDPATLYEKTAEMTNASIYFTGGAQNPQKQIKFDFYYMHCVNCSIFYHAFLDQTWISDENKCRLLEWKGRVDLCMYASRRSPAILTDEISNYRPKISSSWDGVFTRVRKHEDDGHASKLVRALAHGEKLCEASNPSGSTFKIKDDMWLQLGHMAIDSVEASGDPWVRSAGFPQAWEQFEDRPRAQL